MNLHEIIAEIGRLRFLLLEAEPAERELLLAQVRELLEIAAFSPDPRMGMYVVPALMTLLQK